MLTMTNTLTRAKEEFKPLNEAVRMFVCGPTVYGPMHIGHAKTYTQFDFIARVLKLSYPNLRYALNVTDLDDKIIKRAKEESRDAVELAREEEKLFFQNMTKLGNTAHTETHRALDYIPAMLSQIKRLEELGKAYVIPDSGVYYDLSTYPAHGRLAGRNVTGNEQTRLVENYEKRNAGDFVLWKFAKPGEPSWPSPWGEGRPGWHIEDTAITEEIFGPSYDIHGGATDLIFPHHEAELAQMEGITGEPLVSYWLHTGLLNTGGKKMGKSLNNFVTVTELLESWAPETLRYAFLSSHYRSTLDFSLTLLEASKAARERVEEYYRERAQRWGKETYEAFVKLVEDDFNTPKALALMFDHIREGIASQESLELINELLKAFVFRTVAPPEEVLALSEEREQARSAKNWSRADELRSAIKLAGWTVKDTPGGPVLSQNQP